MFKQPITNPQNHQGLGFRVEGFRVEMALPDVA